MVKKAKGKAVAREEEPVLAVQTDATALEVDEGDPVQVNTANLLELKRATDDYVKEFFGRTYNRSHRHEDVHLALGWSASLSAFAMSLYAWYIPFKDCKNWVLLGTIISFTCSGLLWLWLRFVVRDIVFEGKRKTFANRIETETLTVHSKILPQPEANPPLLLTLKYAQSTNGGKSVISSAERVQSLAFGEVFDAEGILHKRVLAELLSECEADVRRAKAD